MYVLYLLRESTGWNLQVVCLRQDKNTNQKNYMKKMSYHSYFNMFAAIREGNCAFALFFLQVIYHFRLQWFSVWKNAIDYQTSDLCKSGDSICSLTSGSHCGNNLTFAIAKILFTATGVGCIRWSSRHTVAYGVSMWSFIDACLDKPCSFIFDVMLHKTWTICCAFIVIGAVATEASYYVGFWFRFERQRVKHQLQTNLLIFSAFKGGSFQ